MGDMQACDMTCKMFSRSKKLQCKQRKPATINFLVSPSSPSFNHHCSSTSFTLLLIIITKSLPNQNTHSYCVLLAPHVKIADMVASLGYQLVLFAQLFKFPFLIFFRKQN